MDFSDPRIRHAPSFPVLRPRSAAIPLCLMSGQGAVVEALAGDSRDAQFMKAVAPTGFTGRIESTLEPRLRRRIDRDLADLGRTLFFDKIAGLPNDNTCVGCHSPTNGLGDSQSIAIGVQDNWHRRPTGGPPTHAAQLTSQPDVRTEVQSARSGRKGRPDDSSSCPPCSRTGSVPILVRRLPDPSGAPRPAIPPHRVPSSLVRRSCSMIELRLSARLIRSAGSGAGLHPVHQGRLDSRSVLHPLAPEVQNVLQIATNGRTA
jgi:hypothetical protein